MCRAGRVVRLPDHRQPEGHDGERIDADGDRQSRGELQRDHHDHPTSEGERRATTPTRPDSGSQSHRSRHNQADRREQRAGAEARQDRDGDRVVEGGVVPDH